MYLSKWKLQFKRNEIPSRFHDPKGLDCSSSRDRRRGVFCLELTMGKKKEPVMVRGECWWRCTKCGELKPTEGFHKNKSRSNGLYERCILCEKKQRAIYRKCPTYKARKKAYESTPRGAELTRAHKRRWNVLNKEKRRAHSKIQNDLKRGRQTKQPCVVCGEGEVEAHHHDYSKPLDVVWLCSKHHRDLHRNLRLSPSTQGEPTHDK